MNLTRVLNNALPEIPARMVAERYPCLDPGTTFREHIEDGKVVVRIYVPSIGGMYTFQPQEWQLARLFDGRRTFAEIAELYSQKHGVEYDAETVREFAGDLEAGGFWYKTQQEKNILFLQQSAEERRKKLKVRSRWADLSEIVFPAFNPERFLNWFCGLTKFVYTPWFTVLTLALFALGAGITITHWSEIGRDTVEFYNFSNKSWGDVFVLYAIGMFVVAVHEFGHAHTCKHYGGRVPAMGFALVYLTPAFYTDTTEGFVQGSRSQRLVIALGGIWSEMMLCSVATPIWWGTPPDTLVHNVAYFTMMLTGLMSLVINWNPLMKLDGYLMLCEVIGIAELKEDSTAYVSSWVKKRIWRLPVEVPYVPRRRRFGFAVYALLSGAYSYTVLYVVARFAGNIVRNFSPEWGFIPELGVAAIIFRSRIRLLVNFMKFVYLDKKDRIIAWFTPRHTLAVTAGLVVFLGLPLRRESVSGRFLLEAEHRALVRAQVSGVIARLDVEEGQDVAAGAPLATLRNVPLQSDYEDLRARLRMASERANAASLQYLDYGTALKEREHLEAQFQQLSEMDAALHLTSPISGTVVSPRVRDMLGTYLHSGGELLEIADLTSLRARIYISEYDLSKIQPGAEARVLIEGVLGKRDSQAAFIAPQPTEMDPRLIGEARLLGLNPPHFYLVDLTVPNRDMALRPGMAGLARVYGRKRSLLGMAWEAVSNFWGRKLW